MGGRTGTDLEKKSEHLQNSGEIVGFVLDSRRISEEVGAENCTAHDKHRDEPWGVVTFSVGTAGGREKPVAGLGWVV